MPVTRDDVVMGWPHPEPPRHVVRIKTVTEVLDCERHYVYKLIDAGVVRTVTIQNRLFVLADDVYLLTAPRQR